jgi:hypothetical protein
MQDAQQVKENPQQPLRQLNVELFHNSGETAPSLHSIGPFKVKPKKTYPPVDAQPHPHPHLPISHS